MATKLIELDDGTLVEVEVPGEQIREVSGSFADRVDATFDKIRPLLVRTCRPIVAAMRDLKQDTNIDEAEVEMGLSFEAEGNLYLTKSTAGANLTVRLLLKPND